MPDSIDISFVCDLCHYLSNRYPSAAPGMQRVYIVPGNNERGVLYFHVWVTPHICASVFLAQRDCEGKTRGEVRSILDERLAAARVEAMLEYAK